MKKGFSIVWVLAIIIVIAAVAILIWPKSTIKAGFNESNPWLFIPTEGNVMVIHKGKSGIVDYKAGTKIAMYGFNLGKIEIWGTFPDEENILIGTVTQKETPGPNDKGETWIFSFDKDQTVQNLLAIAFDLNGKNVGEINFPYFENINKEQAKEISNWQTYTNEKYDYEVKYPSLYNKVGESNEIEGVTIGTQVMFYYSISVKENIPSLKALQSLMQQGMPSGLKIDWTEATVSGQQAIEMSYEQFAGGYTGITHQTGVFKNGNGYIIALINGSESEYYQILSTFRFLK